MTQYPLKNVNYQEWMKKIQSASMFTITSQEEGLPFLQELNEILSRLMIMPVEQTIDPSLMQYFFTTVFPSVCDKLIKSRYFKISQVLDFANSILSNSVLLVPKFIDFAIEHTKFLEVLTLVFNQEELYFKNNNQLYQRPSPFRYFEAVNSFGNDLKIGDYVDVVKPGSIYDKITWSRGQIINQEDDDVQIAYLNDYYDKTIVLPMDSIEIAPFKSKTPNFQWRFNLKEGDVIDFQDNYRGWRNGTVIAVIKSGQGKKQIKVTMKVYHPDGNKYDENGTFFGFSDKQQTLDMMSPKLQPYCSMAREHDYSYSHSIDQIDDYNDGEVSEINGLKTYALPRKRYLSEFLFKTINKFGQIGGFDIILNYLEKQLNFQVLSYFAKAVGGISAYLHKDVAKQITKKLQKHLQLAIFSENEKMIKDYSKQKSQMIFNGMRSLQERLCSKSVVLNYENQLRRKIVDSCLQSESLKKKLQGLNELKQLIEHNSYNTNKKQELKKWIINRNLFEQVYIRNSHVQLIKKSQEFFKFLIHENLLEQTDLQKLYKIAQHGDYESRISLYKLFKEFSHLLNKQQAQFLINAILQSDIYVILKEDIDFLHQLSRYSSYFPIQKVITFFQNIIFSENKIKQLTEYAIKKYSEMVAKAHEMRSQRRQIIRSFLYKMNTHYVIQSLKVLKGIFSYIGFGQWGKRDLKQILAEENVNQMAIQALKIHKQSEQFEVYVRQILQFLLSIYKISSKVKIHVGTLMKIRNQIKDNDKTSSDFSRWLNDVLKCDQGIVNEGNEELQHFFQQLFPPEKLKSIQESQFKLIKSLFIELNCKLRLISVSQIWKDRETQKQCKRRVSIKNLKMFQMILTVIFSKSQQAIIKDALQFFQHIYISKDNSEEEINELLDQLLKEVEEFYEEKEWRLISRMLTLIQIVINDSEKKSQADIQSLVSAKKGEVMKFMVINETSYTSDSIKKIIMPFSLNMTLMKVRKVLGKEFDCPWQEIRIVGDRQLEDHENSTTLKKLKFDPRCPLTVSRKIQWSDQEEQLILHGHMNPKAVRCFKRIFERFSENGYMNKQNCVTFTTVCLGGSPNSTRHINDRVSSLFNRYNKNDDGLLTEAQFIEFYEDAAKDRPSTVWSNLRTFEVKGNLKFNNEEEFSQKMNTFPRIKLFSNKKVCKILFDLLNEEELAIQAFELLQRLPPDEQIKQQLMKLEVKLPEMLNLANPYIYLYKLYMIQYLLHPTLSSSQEETKWAEKFAQNEGYETIYTFVSQIITSNAVKIPINLEIINSSLTMLIRFWKQSFIGFNENFTESNALLSLQYDIDEKIHYLITGSFLDKDDKLSIQHQEIIPTTEWKGEEPKLIADCLIEGLHQLPSYRCFSEEFMFDSAIVALNILYYNKKPGNFCLQLATLLDKFPQSKTVSKVYVLILCLCSYTHAENKFQNEYIKQLFKNLTKPSITPQLFRVLAFLVSKFGISGTMSSQHNIEGQGQQDKMKQILINNILTNENQLTIEGCTKLLSNFPLNDFPLEYFHQLWGNKLFNPKSGCEKSQTREKLYQLIIKICIENPHYNNEIITTVCSTIESQLPKIKITYCSEFREKCRYGYVGLRNLGSICYINSMMQQLYNNKMFRYLLLRANDQKEINLIQVEERQIKREVDDNLLHQVQRIFAYLDLTSRIDFVPRDFCVAYKPFGQSVNVMVQQDVQEFVGMFFDRLQTTIEKTPLKNVVDCFYGGTNVNLFKCHDCLKTKKVQEKFYSISLQVKNSKTLAESFDRYILGEMINDYKCDFCEKKVDVSKKTRISKVPKTLIIHLQRIVFNLDTFINEKISSKHSFPNNFNIHPYTYDYYEKTQNGEDQLDMDPSYDYTLIGIICHTGTAQAGHYISYIKTQTKWLQFNDSLINIFNPKNIESQCFGGYLSVYDDDFDWDKNQSSKSAYLLLYERVGDNMIEVILNKLSQKDVILNQLKLEEKEKNTEESIQETREKSFEEEQSKESKEQPIKSQSQQNQVVKISNKISPYIPNYLIQEVSDDNDAHFFERSLSQTAFSNFFAQLLLQEHSQQKQLLPLFQKLTFGFWLKSPSFKNLLFSLKKMIQFSPTVFIKFLENPVITNLLIQSSDSEIRTHMAQFLAKIIIDIIKHEQITVDSQTNEAKSIFTFLDSLFDLLPTMVSKCWTKFSQYFEFWYELSRGNKVLIHYMEKKQIVKHFMDYFLDQKSPLKIYAKKKQHQIGSSYANPNFSMLLKCVSSILDQTIDGENTKIGKQEEELLMNCESLEKLIVENYEITAAQLVKKLCPNNLYASQKAAIVLLRGIGKSDFQEISPYLDVLHEYLLINDGFQDIRIKWVLGQQTLALSSRYKKITALNSYTFDERIYNFDSPITVEGGSSLLQKLFIYYKKIQSFVMICLKKVLTLCSMDTNIRNYFFGLSSPVLTMSSFVDFIPKLYEKYLYEAQTVYHNYYAGINKQELGKQVKQLYEKVKIIHSQEHDIPIEQQNKEDQKKEQKKQDNEDYAIQYIQESEFNNFSSDEDEPYLKKKYKSQKYPETWQPIAFAYNPIQSQSFDGVIVEKHESVVTLVKTKPNGYSNNAFGPQLRAQKISERLLPEFLENKRQETVSGYFISNKTYHPVRIQTEDGCEYCRGNSSVWVWGKMVVKVWQTERQMDWPTWSLNPQA